MEKGVPIRSISRAIAVVQAVNRHGSLTLMEIANKAEVPYPTACRIVQTLLMEGMIEREPARKRYRPTALVHTLSYGFQSPDELVGASRPHIIELTKKVGWPVAITVRVGQSMMVRDSTHALTSLTLTIYYPGWTLPILECASGRAYLAFMPEEERQVVLKGLAATQPPQRSSLDTLSLFQSGFLIKEIQGAGYATKGRNPFTANPGKTSSIAVPLFQAGRLVGAMTLIFFASAKKMDDAVKLFAPELKATAEAIGLTLAETMRQAA